MDYDSLKKENKPKLIEICRDKELKITGNKGVLIERILNPSQGDKKKATQNDLWKHILEQNKYKGEDNFNLSAKDIKKCSSTWSGEKNQFEPRLLCYQGHFEELPEIFKEMGICIFSIKNGLYIITKQNIYEVLKYKEVPLNMLKRDNTSLVLRMGNSETSLIDNLRYSGVFESSNFMNESINHEGLLMGRHYCSFDMNINKQQHKIEGVQFETDKCYESDNCIMVIEGKSVLKKLESFNLRQLYFPFRYIYDKTNGKKKIICAFITQYNDIISIWKYTFTDHLNMSSISCTGLYEYKFSN